MQYIKVAVPVVLAVLLSTQYTLLRWLVGLAAFLGAVVAHMVSTPAISK